MGKFHIDATELYWIDGSADDPEDLCLHAVPYAKRFEKTL